MRSIIAVVIMLSASTSLGATTQVEKRTYTQALISHRQTVQASPDKIGVDPVRSNTDGLTKRIEQDNIRLDHVMEICPSC
jgi:hypothetical protein